MNHPHSNVKWSVACSVLSTAATGFMVVAHLMPLLSALVINSFIEGIVAVILAVFWGATVAVTSDASDSRASALFNEGGVSNANIYYFSWASFVCAVMLVVNYVRFAFGIDLVGEVNNRGARLNLWAALIACSLVVAGSSARIKNSLCDSSDKTAGTAFCARCKLGISVGSIVVVLSVVVVGAKMFMPVTPTVIETAMAALAGVLETFSVAYVTSNEGPGARIGNLYYFSWASFLVSAFLFAECVGQVRGETAAAIQNKASNNGGDVQVEVLDDPNL